MTIWLRPGDSIEAILARPSRWQVPILGILNGISVCTLLFIQAGFPLDSLAYFALLGVPTGLVNVYLLSFVLFLVAKSFGGRATAPALRLVTAWSGLPVIAGFIPSLLIAWLRPAWEKLALGLLSLCLMIWFLALLIAMVRRVEGFRTGRALAACLLTLAACALPPQAVRWFLMESFVASSASMTPTLRKGDALFVAKGPLAGPPSRGELVVFRLGADGAPYVKRIVGLPGDRVQVRHHVLIINGQPVPRERLEVPKAIIYRETLPDGPSFEIEEASATTELPADNTEEYVVPEGHCFVLGDNRDNSLDSRFMDKIGYIPLANLVGRVVLLSYSRNDQNQIAWDRIGVRPR